MTKRVTRRVRVTLSLPASLVRRLDERGRRAKVSRSAMVERMLTDNARALAQQELAAEVADYYTRADEPPLTKALGAAARRLRIDE